jgi:hypothetical protein
MPKGYPPSVFVSSTCYDLNQVRADMKRFFDGMGLDPILSETPSFAVNPQTGPVENCLQAVKERADIFVLIVGDRYGSQNESGKSITNLEYLEARAKGVPVYAFVLKRILNVLPVWKKNPEANYEGTVDTPKLFAFVDSLRSAQNHWVYEFDEAQQIIDTLRRQLAYLFMEGLILRKTVNDLQLAPSLRDLSGPCLKLILERPMAWEFRFFSTALEEEMNADQSLKWDLQFGLKLTQVHELGELPQMFDWIRNKLSKIKALIHSVECLMNQAIQEALGPQGEPGNPELLLYVAKRVAHVRKELVHWALEFRCTDVQPECERLLSLTSDMSKDAIMQIETIPSRLNSEISKAVEAVGRGERYTAELIVKLTTPYSDELAAEFEKLNEVIRRRFDQ